MKTQKTLFICILLIVITTNAQITKNNWMLGGNAGFNSTTVKNNNGELVSNNLSINPSVGYFFKDNLVAGVRLATSTFINKVEPTVISIGLEPHLRYYFLKPEKRTNFFMESNYYFGGTTNGNFNSNGFGFTAGPVIFLNSSVGIEIGLNYSRLKTKNSINSFENADINKFNILVGFQIHLEK